MSSDRRQPRLPVRLSAEPRGLPARFTMHTIDLSAGGVALESEKQMPEGLRFRLGLVATEGSEALVEIMVEVVNVRPRGDKYLVGTRFCGPPSDLANLQTLIGFVLRAPEPGGKRQHPRIRVRIPAREKRDGEPHFLVEDVSLGGMRVAMLGTLREGLVAGDVVSLEAITPKKSVHVTGEVAWTAPASSALPNPSFGVSFQSSGDDWTQLLLRWVLGIDQPGDLVLELPA